jgi:hypothetical protein
MIQGDGKQKGVEQMEQIGARRLACKGDRVHLQVFPRDVARLLWRRESADARIHAIGVISLFLVNTWSRSLQ